MVRASVQRHVDRLDRNEVVAVGGEPGWPRDHKLAVGTDYSLEEAKALVRATLLSHRVRVAQLRGTMVSSRNQNELLAYVASLLPQSRVLCLNVGEYPQASLASYKLLSDALPLSFVGNLYWDSPGPAEMLKDTAKARLRANRKKDFYRIESVRPEVWRFVRVGCHAWWNVQPSRTLADGTRVLGVREATEQLKKDRQPTGRCRVRCRQQRCIGLNAKNQRCCLCTNHASLYCWRHQQKPYSQKRIM